MKLTEKQIEENKQLTDQNREKNLVSDGGGGGCGCNHSALVLFSSVFLLPF